MNPSVWPTAAVVVVGLALAWRFALAHAAVAAVSRARLRELADQGVGRADRLYLLLARRDAVQTALRLGYLGSLVVIAAAGWWLAHATPWPAAMGSGLLLATCLGAELWPRLLAAAQGEQAALRQARWVTTAYRLWGPLAGWLSADEPARDEPDDEGTAESFREMVDTAPLKATQRRRITEILDFPDRAAADIMVPRVDVVALPADASLPAAAELVSASGYSRIPVYQESREDIIGVLHARDLLAHWPGVGTAGELVRPPLYVPATQRLDQLLRQMRAQRSSVAVVVDEFGGTAGLVTVEDVIEQIVGEIQDETDVTEAGPRPRPGGGWIVPARLPLDELGELLGLEFDPDLEVNTLGGLALAWAGDLPEPGEVLVGEAGEVRLVLAVLSVDGTRLRELALLVQPRPAGEELPAAAANPWSSTGPWPLDMPLERLTAALRLEPAPTAGATIGDLLAFEPLETPGRTILWRSQRLRLIAGADGWAVALEPDDVVT